MLTPFLLQWDQHMDPELTRHPVRLVIGIAIALAVTLAVYFLPAWLARGKRNQQNIFWLTGWTGWTGLGWVGALVWALKDEKAERERNPFLPTVELSIKADELAQLDALHESGALTDPEYDQRKRQLLRPGLPAMPSASEGEKPTQRAKKAK